MVFTKALVGLSSYFHISPILKLVTLGVPTFMGFLQAYPSKLDASECFGIYKVNCLTPIVLYLHSIPC